MTDDEPMLTPEEEAELVERINANPNLHPLPPVGKDAAWLRDYAIREYGPGPTNDRLNAIADRLSVMEEALRYIAGHDAAANGLSGFAFELVEMLTGAAREALAKLEQQEDV